MRGILHLQATQVNQFLGEVPDQRFHSPKQVESCKTARQEVRLSRKKPSTPVTLNFQTAAVLVE
jgi:hypothetical protein